MVVAPLQREVSVTFSSSRLGDFEPTVGKLFVPVVTLPPLRIRRRLAPIILGKLIFPSNPIGGGMGVMFVILEWMGITCFLGRRTLEWVFYTKRERESHKGSELIRSRIIVRIFDDTRTGTSFDKYRDLFPMESVE